MTLIKNKAIRIVLWIVAFIITLFLLALLFFTIIDYKPNMVEPISNSNEAKEFRDTSFTIMTWNIGYAGLSEETDFFYDGGKMMRPEEAIVMRNLDSISAFISGEGKCDFIMLQEVDVNAKRSYGKNQVKHISQHLQGYNTYFAKNYDVLFVPLPIYEPMGKVEAGLVSYCKSKAYKADRHTFPFNFDWPVRVFMLDRCFLETRYRTDNGKDLIIINTHNSAFDDKGSIRKAELNFFREYLIAEYKKGNYLVVGGDFNQSPPKLETDFNGQPFDYKDFVTIPDTFLSPDWHFAYDNKTPSNRRVVAEYKYGETLVTLIDFFITSPNVETDTIYCRDLRFKHSDHNPVIARFKLKK